MVTLTPPFLDVNSCLLCTCQCTQKCQPLGTEMGLGPVGFCCAKPVNCQAQVPLCWENQK